METIYVEVRHWNFWYGVYGFCNHSRNDEITLYLDKDKNHFLGHFDLLTEPCLVHLLTNELDRVEDREFCEEIEAFLENQHDVVYSYIYPRDEEDLADQVNHFAPFNEKGHKPIYINVMSKRSAYWDVTSIKDITRRLTSDFLQEEIIKVEFINVPTYEESQATYEQDYKRFVK
ncbi:MULTISPECIES: hypothetical protein [Paenibacillus]|uniref:hypothetical protein n=1 Tax=Paenibacillus TaxID=44249 RepID=UPI0011A0C5AB|nr:MULTISPECIES: hypothetical protein [Paenibacillus]MCM3171951.1 hypothetical protein [Paenibacillus sp. MER 99-2]